MKYHQIELRLSIPTFLLPNSTLENLALCNIAVISPLHHLDTSVLHPRYLVVHYLDYVISSLVTLSSILGYAFRLPTALSFLQ